MLEAARSRASLVILAVSFVCTIRSVSAGEEWTRFRGPNGSGISPAAGLPVEFGPERAVVWKTALPPGHSSPVLTPTRVFLTAHTKEKENTRLLVLCLDRGTGAILWQREVPRTRAGRLRNVNSPASPTPITDGTNVYAFFQDFGLAAFDGQGKEKWRLPLGPFNMYYGFGASPILVGDAVILPVDQDLGAHLIAVSKDSGKVKWRVPRPEVLSGYSTPMVYRPAVGPEQIVIPESFQLSSYAVRNGKRLWWVRGLACEMKSVPSSDGTTLFVNGWGFPQNQPGKQVPTFPFGEGLKRYDRNRDGFIAKEEVSGGEPIDRILAADYGFEAFDLDRDGRLDSRDWEAFRRMMASENGLLAISLGGRGDMTDKAVRWQYQRPVPQVPSTLLYQGVLFMVNDGGILTSFDPKTGNVIKQDRLKGAIDKYFASPVGADGKVWLASLDGTVSVVSAQGRWEVLAVNPLDDQIYATPAVSEGRLFIRTQGWLYCFGK